MPISVDEELVSHIGVSMLSKSKLNVDGDIIEILYACSYVSLLIKKKVIFLYAYKNYTDMSDFNWTRSNVKEWALKISSFNTSFKFDIISDGNTLDPKVQELISGDKVEFRIEDHAKSRGLDVGFKYPMSWKAGEGRRPNIIQNFKGEIVDGSLPNMLVMAIPIPTLVSLFQSDLMIEEYLPDSLSELLPQGATFLESGKTHFDGEPGIWLKFYFVESFSDFDVINYSVLFYVYYEGKIVTLQCSVGGRAEYKDLHEAAY